MTYEMKGLWILFPTPPNLPYLEFGVRSYAYFSEALSSSEFLRIVALVTTRQTWLTNRGSNEESSCQVVIQDPAALFKGLQPLIQPTNLHPLDDSSNTPRPSFFSNFQGSRGLHLQIVGGPTNWKSPVRQTYDSSLQFVAWVTICRQSLRDSYTPW